MSATTDWSRGYPVGAPYPPSWHYFQSPAHLRAICALMGVAWEVGPELPLAIAEVGCGTGYTAAVLAAGTPNAQVLGLDYNPAHIAEARSLASAAGLQNLRYEEADLADLSDAALDRLPEFDLITAHGVWSWVGDPVREGLLRLLRRRLKPGGVVMISYNAMPGAAGSQGLARLVRASLQSASDPAAGIERARQQVRRLVAAEATHLLPSGWRRIFTDDDQILRTGYVQHEFLTEHWRPVFFADMAAAMATARCDFVGSASIDENFPQMSLSAAQRELWDEAPDEAGRQLVLDLCAPRAFRRDVYVRGLRRVPRDPAVDALWLAAADHADGPVTLQTQAGIAELPQPLIDAVRAALKTGPQTIAALRSLPACAKATPAELAAMLIGSTAALPLWQRPGDGAGWEHAVTAARRFNAAASERLAPYGVGAGQFGLATPALGGGLAVSALELAVARWGNAGLAAAERQPGDETGAAVWDAQALTQRIVPPGLSPGPEIVSGLEQAIQHVLARKLPAWQRLGIA
jgi:SAM-dependent methyltransferase